MQKSANILDPVQNVLPEIWDNPRADKPKLKPRYSHFITKTIFAALERHGYGDPQDWCSLYLTGSLTTYQYSPNSDVDINLFIHADKVPEWSRSEMVGIMVGEVDGTPLSGTPYVLQAYVLPHGVKPADKYAPGIRAGYDIENGRWIEPPDRKRTMDVEKAENGWYVQGEEAADKLEALLRYEPHKALQYYNQVHHRRQRDAEKGDFGSANIIYKFWDKRGLLDKVHALAGNTHIAAYGLTPDELIPEQKDFFHRLFEYNRGRDDEAVPIVSNPPEGTRIWRGEYADLDGDTNLRDRKDLGKHWTVNPISAHPFGNVIWQATIDDPKHVSLRDEPQWEHDPPGMQEYEVRLHPDAQVNLEGYWTPTGAPGNTYFWPYDGWPDDLQEQTGIVRGDHWEFHPVGQRVPIARPGKGLYATPFDWKTPEQLWEEKEMDEESKDALAEYKYDRNMTHYHRNFEQGNPWKIGEPT